MKSIVLHRAASDNVGGYQDAGAELVVSGQKVAGHIAADRAKALVGEGGAIAPGSPAPGEKAGKGD